MSPMSQSVSVSLAAMAGDIRAALLIQTGLYPVADDVSLALLALESLRHAGDLSERPPKASKAQWLPKMPGTNRVAGRPHASL